MVNKLLMSTSVKVILYSSKTLKNGEHPVMLRVIKNRKSKYLSTGFSCSKELWDEKSNLPKKKHPLFIEVKMMIAQKVKEAEKLVLELESDSKDLSASEITKKLKKPKSNSYLVLEYFDIVSDRLIASGEIKNARVYSDTKRNISLYTKGVDFSFSDVDYEFLKKFEEFLKAKKQAGNSIYLYLRTFRALFNKAINENVCNEKYYPFNKFSLSKYNKIKTQKRAITQIELDRIINLDFSNDTNLIDARNIFLFSYYCRGINFIDISLLKWENINNGRLTYVRQKTKELFSMTLLKPAMEIIESYRSFTFKNKDSYIFPIFNDSHNTPNAIFNRREKMNKMINQNLKKIATLASINQNLTIYVARHTFANIMKNKGTPNNLISEMMGHDSEATTKIYLENFGDSVLDAENEKLL
jgi:site-specific recombinase XerD